MTSEERRAGAEYVTLVPHTAEFDEVREAPLKAVTGTKADMARGGFVGRRGGREGEGGGWRRRVRGWGRVASEGKGVRGGPEGGTARRVGGGGGGEGLATKVSGGGQKGGFSGDERKAECG